MNRHLSFWVGFFAATILAIPIASGIIGAAEQELRRAAVILFVAVVTILLILVIVLVFRDQILRRLLGRTEVALQDVAASLIRAASAAGAGDRTTATDEAQTFVRQGLGWYAWTNLYRWVIATAVGLLLAFGAFVGTILLFEQTRTLREQTRTLKQQTETLILQTERFGEQTALMELQTDRLTKQTTQMTMQNEILTLSLVGELRDQILNSTEQFDVIDALGREADFVDSTNMIFSRDGRCAAGFADPLILRKPPDMGTLNAIVKLAQEGLLAEQVTEALGFLTHDNDPVVALSAVRVLDRVDPAQHYVLWELDGLMIEDMELRGAHELIFDASIVFALDCAHCKVRFRGSYGAYPPLGDSETADAGRGSATTSMMVDNYDQHGPVLTPGVMVVPAPADTETAEAHHFDVFGLDDVPISSVLAGFPGLTACQALDQFTRRNPVLTYTDLTATPD